MASRKVAGDSTRYAESPHQAYELESNHFQANHRNLSSDTDSEDTGAEPKIPRTRKRSTPKQHAIGVMSFVGLKNFFFRSTITPVFRSKAKSGAAYDCSSVSSRPLLRQNDPTMDEAIMSPNSDDGDLESQSVDSKTEKAYQKKKGFRVDARIISDATIGLSDGLTVPFALTAGLSALGNTKVVIYGGFAELIAGAISMGLGGYLGAKSEL